MTRLFTAFFPDDQAVKHLAAALAPITGVRWQPVEKWHITLAFHGDGDDPDRRIAWLRAKAEGLVAPRIRLRSAGLFRDVLWIGVDGPLAPIASAVTEHTDRYEYTPHLTIARSSRKELDPGPLVEYEGPWWTAAELVLVQSARDLGGHRYTPLDRVRLAAR